MKVRSYSWFLDLGISEKSFLLLVLNIDFCRIGVGSLRYCEAEQETYGDRD